MPKNEKDGLCKDCGEIYQLCTCDELNNITEGEFEDAEETVEPDKDEEEN